MTTAEEAALLLERIRAAAALLQGQTGTLMLHVSSEVEREAARQAGALVESFDVESGRCEVARVQMGDVRIDLIARVEDFAADAREARQLLGIEAPSQENAR